MKTILVVDDTTVNIKIVVELLGDVYDIVACRDGETALEIVYQDKPDLILLDIMMPDLDGFEVCKRLKANNETKDIPIIFLTAKEDEQSIVQAYSLGGCDYIKKPFISIELSTRVHRAIELINLQNRLEEVTSK